MSKCANKTVIVISFFLLIALLVTRNSLFFQTFVI